MPRMHGGPVPAMTPVEQLDAWWRDYTDDEVSLEEWESLSVASKAILEAGWARVEGASVTGGYVELPFGLMARALLTVERKTPE